MKQRKVFIISILAFVMFCISLLWKSCEEEKEMEIIYTIKSEPTETSLTKVSETTYKINTITTVKETVLYTVSTTVTMPSIPLYIDLNTADAQTLCLLNGIGEKLSEEIIRYRDENGKFNNIEEIMMVHGIGEKIFADVRDFIYVTDPVYPIDESENDIEEILYEEPPIVEETEPGIEPELTLDDVTPIELNSADVELLTILPYIDDLIAEKIIELREEIGGFSHPYELLYIEELSREQVAEIIEYVYVEKSEVFSD